MNRHPRQGHRGGPNTTRNGGESPNKRYAILAALVIAFVTGALMTKGQLPFFEAALFGVNGASLFLCGFDKSIAGGKTTRVPELLLLSLALLGGTLGLLVGMILFRYKTMKSAFIWRFAVIVCAQLLLLRLFLVNSSSHHGESGFAGNGSKAWHTTEAEGSGAERE